MKKTMKTKDRFGRNRIGESIRLNRSKFTQTTGPVIDLFPNSSQQGEERVIDPLRVSSLGSSCPLHPAACDSTVTTATVPGLELPRS